MTITSSDLKNWYGHVGGIKAWDQDRDTFKKDRITCNKMSSSRNGGYLGNIYREEDLFELIFPCSTEAELIDFIDKMENFEIINGQEGSLIVPDWTVTSGTPSFSSDGLVIDDTEKLSHPITDGTQQYFRIRLTFETGATFYAALNEDNTSIVDISLDGADNLRCRGNVIKALVAGTTYDILYDIDWTARTTDIYVDGTLEAAGVGIVAVRVPNNFLVENQLAGKAVTISWLDIYNSEGNIPQPKNDVGWRYLGFIQNRRQYRISMRVKYHD